MLNILKKIQQLKKENKSKGITLVIAITVMTLLLSISFSISNIVLRQIRISGVTNMSKPAFFIADSAAECAFYYDTLEKNIDSNGAEADNTVFETALFGSDLDPTTGPNRIRENIKCGGSYPLNPIKTQISADPLTISSTFDLTYDDMCAKVEVVRTEVSTKIISRGYNSGAGAGGCDLENLNTRRVVERGLTITY